MAKNIIKDSPETLEKAIQSMQGKIEELKEEFEMAELTYEAEMGDGRTILRANPFVQEYRALVKDFCSAVKAYKEITGGQEPAEVSSLDELRSKFKVAK